MAIGNKGFGLKNRFQDAVRSTKEAVGKVDLSAAKEKLQETGNAAKEAAKKVKIPDVDAAGLKDVFRKSEKHTVVQLSGSKIRLLLPDGYERLKYRNPLKNAAKSIIREDSGYRKTVETSDNVVMIFKTTPDNAMNPDDLQGLIDGIHRNMSDSQGIIEAKKGVTRREYRYIYSIVKTLLSKDAGGVRYFLRMNVFHKNEILEIQAEFTEIRMTGKREAICVDFARRAGLADIFKDGYKDWAGDPYDPEYTRGVPKNLAEREGLDGLFPENPLSQAREFLLAVLKDELVTTCPDDDDDGESGSEEKQESEDNLSAEEKAEREKSYFRDLFVDECRRYTVAIEVEKQKPTAEKDEESDDREGRQEVQQQERDREKLLEISAISTKSAVKIIYYLMAADGQIFHSEEEKFNDIGRELDPHFQESRDQIIEECQSRLDSVVRPEDYYRALQEGVEEALTRSKQTEDTFITPKMLVWNLLTIAFSDENYDESEKKLISYIVDRTAIDKAVFLEMESSILTLLDIEKELQWIKTTSKPYLTIEAMVNELADRKNVIFESVKDLISL